MLRHAEPVLTERQGIEMAEQKAASRQPLHDQSPMAVVPVRFVAQQADRILARKLIEFVQRRYSLFRGQLSFHHLPETILITAPMRFSPLGRCA